MNLVEILEEGVFMVTAIITLVVDRSRIIDVAQEIADIEGVFEVYSVSGRYDLVAIVRTSDSDRLAELVTGRLLKVGGILKSETLVAFRAYSRHDLERMFTIGFEEK